MSLNNVQYESILRSYEEKQLNSRHALEMRYEEVYKKTPSYKDLEDAISSISVSQGRKLLAGDEDALPELKIMIHELKEQKHLTLIKAGFSKDYLTPVYDCSLCKDTGYINGKKCLCFKQAIINLLYEQSNIRELLQTDNFSTLSFEYYQGDDLDKFKNAVDTCKNFVKNFNSDYHNLFFYGTVGTGKSFLSGCIAKELIEKGNVVIYFSSTALFEVLSKHTFDFKAKEELSHLLEDLYHCDLLIIDDLGTELTNAFVASQLFSCLNERHIRKNATIISTNLSLEELSDRYSDRIFSRITSHYEVCKLSGPDIRMYKKRMLNRK
ncbi:MAG TPA: ATP-binding protein [Lachnospiraceae bacterium]|nr:ATP-binding protein [Lachnospiraceae bacterium]